MTPRPIPALARAPALLLALLVALAARAAAQCPACGDCTATATAPVGSNATLFARVCSQTLESAFLTALRVNVNANATFRLFTQAAAGSSRVFAPASVLSPVPCFAMAPSLPPTAPLFVGGLYFSIFVTATCVSSPTANCTWTYHADGTCQDPDGFNAASWTRIWNYAAGCRPNVCCCPTGTMSIQGAAAVLSGRTNLQGCSSTSDSFEIPLPTPPTATLPFTIKNSSYTAVLTGAEDLTDGTLFMLHDDPRCSFVHTVQTPTATNLTEAAAWTGLWQTQYRCSPATRCCLSGAISVSLGDDGLVGTAPLAGSCGGQQSISFHAPFPREDSTAFRAAGFAPFRLDRSGAQISLTNVTDAAGNDRAVLVVQGDSCVTAANCVECAARSGCGFCAASRRCMTSAELATCTQALSPSSAECNAEAKSGWVDWQGSWEVDAGSCDRAACCCVVGPLSFDINTDARTLSFSALVEGNCAGHASISALLPLPGDASGPNSTTSLWVFDEAFNLSKQLDRILFSSGASASCSVVAFRGGSDADESSVYEHPGFIAGVSVAALVVLVVAVVLVLRLCRGRAPAPLASTSSQGKYLLAGPATEIQPTSQA